MLKLGRALISTSCSSLALVRHSASIAGACTQYTLLARSTRDKMSATKNLTSMSFNPRYYFSSQPQQQEQKAKPDAVVDGAAVVEEVSFGSDSQPAAPTKSQQELNYENLGRVFEYLRRQRSDANRTVNGQFYSDDQVFQNTQGQGNLKKALTMNVCAFVFWAGASGVVYQYVNHYLTIVPAFFTLSAIITYINARSFFQRLILYVTLDESKETVKLFTAMQQEIECAVKDVHVEEVMRLTMRETRSLIQQPLTDEELTQAIQNEQYIFIQLTAQDLKGVQHKDLRLSLNNVQEFIENYGLLQDILFGQAEKVRLYEKREEEEVARINEQREQEINDILEKLKKAAGEAESKKEESVAQQKSEKQ